MSMRSGPTGRSCGERIVLVLEAHDLYSDHTKLFTGAMVYSVL